MDWDTYFIGIANSVAAKSKDPSVKVGAVIVGPSHEIRSTGYNDLPRGVVDTKPERRVRPDKYLWTEHAESNAILSAARAGISTNGCTIYINCSPLPCAGCARAIIQAGIIRVVGPKIEFPSTGDWARSFEVARIMLNEAEVEFNCT